MVEDEDERCGVLTPGPDEIAALARARPFFDFGVSRRGSSDGWCWAVKGRKHGTGVYGVHGPRGEQSAVGCCSSIIEKLYPFLGSSMGGSFERHTNTLMSPPRLAIGK